MSFIVYAKAGDSFQQIGGECPAGFIKMNGLRPDGDYIAAESGEWIPKPPPSQDELISLALDEKDKKLAGAHEKISFWQAELQLGIISDSDKAELIRWMKYIKALNVVDVSAAPDIDWPMSPDEEGSQNENENRVNDGVDSSITPPAKADDV